MLESDAYNKTFLNCNIRLLHVSFIVHFHWKLIKLKHTNVLYICCSMLVVIIPGELSARDKLGQKK